MEANQGCTSKAAADYRPRAVGAWLRRIAPDPAKALSELPIATPAWPLTAPMLGASAQAEKKDLCAYPVSIGWDSNR
jgi:hypothetical protein